MPPKARPIRIKETGQVFRSARTLAQFLNGDYSAIFKVLRGERKTHKGYSFEYNSDFHKKAPHL